MQLENVLLGVLLFLLGSVCLPAVAIRDTLRRRLMKSTDSSADFYDLRFNNLRLKEELARQKPVN
jgi:hypothetical protein